MQCWIFELLLNFHARSVKKIVFERFELGPSMRYDTILICHDVLGTENIVSQRIQTDNHKIGKNGAAMEVAALYNQMNNE